MEEYMKKASENAIPKTASVEEELLLKEKVKIEIAKRCTEDLKKEEIVLKNYLERLKKEGFLIQAQIRAWQVDLKKKLERFKKVELDLNEVHRNIWSTRESFCSDVDEIDDEFGVLSNWWRAQMDYVCDLENFRQKKIEEKHRKEEIEILEKEVESLEMKIAASEEQQSVRKTDANPLSEDPDFNTSSSEDSLPGEAKHSEGNSDEKKVILANADDEVLECYSQDSSENFLFSMMNLSRVRKAKEKEKRQKNREVKKFIKHQIKYFHRS